MGVGWMALAGVLGSWGHLERQRERRARKGRGKAEGGIKVRHRGRVLPAKGWPGRKAHVKRVSEAVCYERCPKIII